MIQQRLEHGRHAGQRRRLHPLHRGQHLRRIEARQHHHLAAIHDRAVERAGIGEDMEERQDRDDPVGLMLVRVDRLRLSRVGGQILMRQHRALTATGGTRCIQNRRQIMISFVDCFETISTSSSLF